MGHIQSWGPFLPLPKAESGDYIAELPWTPQRSGASGQILAVDRLQEQCPVLLFTPSIPVDPRKTLPSCYGLCQVARSPWELSQGKEGDQREEKEWERWRPGGIPMGFGGRWAGSMPALGGRLEIISANPSLSGGEPKIQTEGTCPRSYSRKSDEARLESETWELVRCLLLSGHLPKALEIPFLDIHLCALCVHACVCRVCACVCTCGYVCPCLCCDRVWAYVWPAPPLFGEEN